MTRNGLLVVAVAVTVIMAAAWLSAFDGTAKWTATNAPYDLPDADVATAVPTILNVSLSSADTEYSQVLTGEVVSLNFQMRDATDLRYAFEPGKVAGPTAPYFTVKAGNFYFKDKISLESPTIYFASSGTNKVVEVEAWIK